MNRRLCERSIWGISAVALILTARQIRANGAADDSTRRGRPGTLVRSTPSSSALEMFDADSLDSAAGRVIAHDPFRLARKPATVAFSIAPNGVVGPPVPAAPPVRIALQGTIGGPPWRAIIAGIPGHDGTIIVSSGDTLGGVSIRRVSRDGVTVRVKDSTWTLTLTK